MEVKQSMPVKPASMEQMLKRVARYKKLVFPPQRYPDSQLPGHERRNYLVVGTGLVVDGGNDPLSAIPINEGFTLSYVEATPGNGPKLHNHDTNETFIPLAGRWAFEYEADDGTHRIELDPYDVISFPPGVQRRFENVVPAPGDEYGLMMAVIGGDSPQAEYSPEAEAMLVKIGRLPAKSAAKA